MTCPLCGALLLPQIGGTNRCSNSCCLANFSDERCPACHQMAEAVARISETTKLLTCKMQHAWIAGRVGVRKTPIPGAAANQATAATDVLTGEPQTHIVKEQPEP